MNGMHQEQHWAYNLGSNDFTASHDFELPPNEATYFAGLRKAGMPEE
jgi:hypothetical protein